MNVTTPDGRVWEVTRRPGRSPRWRDLDDGPLGLDFSSGMVDTSDGFLVSVVVSVLLVVAVAVFILFLLPAILFAGEAILIGVGLVLFAGPWRIEAATAGPPPELHSWRVRGLLRSRRAVREVATELERGDPDAAPEDAEP